MNRAWLRVAWLSGVLALGCQEPYRVGEHVWVEWEPGLVYPAYVVERKGSRFRVHYEGYDPRWDEDVTLDRIKGRVEGPPGPPQPPPPKVAAALGLAPRAASPAASSSAPVAPSASAGAAAPHRPGDRVRVRWRGSVYGAQVLEVVGADRVRVRYDGHEPAWDENVTLDRIVGRR